MENYDEVRCIGRGSYGSAHLVVDRGTGNRFVIKKIPMELLNETEKQQSFREVELLAKLKHPNVVEYRESFVEGNVIHIVMAYCDGGDLAGRIKERAAIVANGGHGYLHDKRILHRDLKTSNIFLTTENVIKLGDFGIAKTLDSTLDQAKTVVGTPYYMSPEVCESKPYSYASDVWSLGCVLYEMIALRHAFDAPNILTLILKIVQNDFAAVPAHYDPEATDILKRLLDKHPERRPTMDQIFMLPYIRNHMQALVESGGSLKKTSRRPHQRHTEKKLRQKRRPSQDAGMRQNRNAVAHRWAAIAPTDREEVVLTGEGSDLELLDASASLNDPTNLDLRLPERSKTPEPLGVGSGDDSREATSNEPEVSTTTHPELRDNVFYSSRTVAWMGSAGDSGTMKRNAYEDEVEEQLETCFPAESTEVLMNPNFQRVYAEECDDSLTVKYANQSKTKPRPFEHSPQVRRSMKRFPSMHGLSIEEGERQRFFDVSATQGSERDILKANDHAIKVKTSPAPYGWSESPYKEGASTLISTRSIHLELDDSANYDDDKFESSNGNTVNLSDSGILQQLEMEEVSSSEDNDDDYSSNSDAGYEGEENFYSEHSAYSDDSDFVGDENETEYSDDFEEADGEVIEYSNDDFATEEENDGKFAYRPVGDAVRNGLKSPKMPSSPASRRAPREVQWVMRNVAQSLMESCDKLSVA